jgi:hypothetical protein
VNGDTIIYSTYLSGADVPGGTSSWAGNSTANGLAVDPLRNAYVALATTAASAPPGAGDAYILKVHPSGSSIIFGTFFGATSVTPSDLALDKSGNVYITGATTAAFGFVLPGPAAQETFGGGIEDAFVAKLNSTGTARVYATYLGGSSMDYGHNIVVDDAGLAYVAGGTTSTNFPTANGFQSTFGAGNGWADAFVTKLSATGDAILYSTYLGGDSEDTAYGLAVDGTGCAYVTGSTLSSNFPTYKPIQDQLKGPGRDVFVTELDSRGNKLLFSTYLGGDGGERGQGIAIVGKDIYIAGYTDDVHFPLQVPFQPAFGGGAADGFIVRLSDRHLFLR